MRQLLSVLATSMLALNTLEALAETPALDWAAVQGGCFSMGEQDAYPEERPVIDVCVTSFEITKTEITNAQFSRFVEATGYVTRAERGWSADEFGSDGLVLPPGSAVFVNPDATQQRGVDWWRFVPGANWRLIWGPHGADVEPTWPVVHVTQEDATAFANWAGGRLPTEAEWEFVARAGASAEAFSKRIENGSANTWQGLFPYLNTSNDGFESMAPVASYPPNSFGIYDMLGNVWEWTSTPYSPSHSFTDRERAGSRGYDPASGIHGVGTIKGGSYLCSTSFCYRFRPAARQGQDLALGTSHIGFRLVRDLARSDND